MRDVSNKTIVALLLVAIVVTVFGTIISVNRISEITGSRGSPSGAVITTATGVSNLTISSSTSITNRVTAIEFGTGYVNPLVTKCIMDTDGNQNQSGSNCTGFNNVTNGFVIENTGNNNVSVNFSCAGSCNAALFIGGTDPVLNFKVMNNSEAAQSQDSTIDTVATCSAVTLGAGQLGAGFTGNGVQIYRPLNISNSTWICGNISDYLLDYTDSKDAFVMDLNITIPLDAPSGQGVKTATFTFTATASG